LSATGITSGLAAIGSIVGGGMATGLVITATAPVAVGAAAYGLYKRSPKKDSAFDCHEKKSKERYNDLQDYIDKIDKNSPNYFKDRLDAQIRLEEFLLKWREAEHAQAWTWVPVLGTPALSVLSLVVSFLALGR
jgi:hypothetical protein